MSISAFTSGAATVLASIPGVGGTVLACFTNPVSFWEICPVTLFKSSKSIMQVWSFIFCSKTLKDSSKLSFPSARIFIFCSRCCWLFLTNFWFSKSKNISYLVSAEKISSKGILSSIVPSISLMSISLSLIVSGSCSTAGFSSLGIATACCSKLSGTGAAGGLGLKKLSSEATWLTDPDKSVFPLNRGSPNAPSGANWFTLFI